MKFVLSSILVSLLLVGHAQTERSNLLKLAEEQTLQKKYPEALENYNKHLAVDSSDGLVYFKRGLVKFYLKQDKAALLDYNKALVLHLGDYEIYYRRGLANYYIKDYKSALEDFNKSISMKSDHSNTYAFRGAVFMALGKDQECVNDETMALWYDPQNVFAYYYRGVSRGKLKEHWGAMADLTSAITLKETADYYYQRALICYELSDYKASVKDASHTIKIKDDFWSAFLLRGMCKISLRENGSAIKDLTRSLELRPAQGKAFYFRGIAKKQSMDIPGACSDLNTAKNLGYAKSLEELEKINCISSASR